MVIEGNVRNMAWADFLALFAALFALPMVALEWAPSMK